MEERITVAGDAAEMPFVTVPPLTIGFDPSMVYAIIVPALGAVICTARLETETGICPPLGEKKGTPAGGYVMVYTAVATGESVIPNLVAMALTVVVPLPVISTGKVVADAAVGAEPSVV